jgi:uncharacterized protein (UPF0303 family)
MTAKEKAKELVDKFKFETKQSEIINDIILGDISVIFKHHKAKQCALIAIDLRLEGDFIFSSIEYGGKDSLEYWIEVKQEIQKL